MALEDDIKTLIERIPSVKGSLTTEEATKQALILPFIQALGYDIFNPNEVTAELTADIGTKQGEKVDYAILADKKPVILIECKKVGDPLTADERVSQLFRYFTATDARIGVLTNGIIYRFFTDLEASNKMDTTPFLEIDLENFNPGTLRLLSQFAKSFDVDKTIADASRLRYTSNMKEVLNSQFSQPEDDFVRWITNRVYTGRLTQSVMENFRTLARQSLHEFVNDHINTALKSLQSATLIQEDIDPSESEENAPGTAPDMAESQDSSELPTVEELDAFSIVKDLVQQVVDSEKVIVRDSKSYCAIHYENNRKPLCRLYFDGQQKRLGLFDGSRSDNGGLICSQFPIESVDDIHNYADQLRETARRYLES